MPGAKKTKKKTPKYEQIIAMDDDRINVLLLGTSGCGKSTLINALLGADEAATGVGEAVTKEIEIYQNDELPFRMIDTVGYEYGIASQHHIRRDIAKFCKEGVRSGRVDKLIHMIWFCIDGTTKRIDQNVLGCIRSVTKSWENVPIIIVFTKSYSRAEIDENIHMAEDAVRKYNAEHRRQLNVKDIIAVVAKEYRIDDTVLVSPMGLDTLTARTIELAPEAKRISRSAVKDIDLRFKNSMAAAVISGAAASATVVGAVPLPLPDAAVLVPVQTVMLNGVASIYGIRDEDLASEIVNTILQVGATTMAGKTLLNSLKAIPGLNAAASLLNAAVAGTITLAAGEISNVLFRKVYCNEMDLKTIDWTGEINRMFGEYVPGIADALKKISEKNNGKIDLETIGQAIAIISKTLSRGGKKK